MFINSLLNTILTQAAKKVKDKTEVSRVPLE
jgi:hypothetical protein